MKHIYTLIIIVCIHITSLYGQQNITWIEVYGGSDTDISRDVLQTIDSGYIFIGYTHSNDIDVSGNNGERDVWVVKLNSQREIEWQKCLGGSDWDIGNKIFYLNDTTYMVLASTRSNDGDIIENHGDNDGWLIKLDLDGNILWQTCYGGEGYDSFSDIYQTIDGGYIVVGSSYSDYINGMATGNNGSSDSWIMKLDSLGIIEWYKIYGGYHEDHMQSVMEANDGGYIVAGTTWSNDGDITGFKGGTDCWILKLDDTGNIEWKKCYGGSGLDYTSSIIRKGNDRYLIAAWSGSDDGDITNNYGGKDVWIFEIDNLGNIEWQKCFGGSQTDQPSKIRSTIDGNLIIAGNTWSNDGDVTGNHGYVDIWILKIDSQHDIIWQKCIGGWGDDRASNVLETEENIYTIIGTTNSYEGDIPFNYGLKDICLFELESNILSIGVASNISGQDSICEGTLSETYSIESIVNATSYTWALDPEIADSIVTNDTVATIYFKQDTIGYASLSVFGSNSSGNSDTSYLVINIFAQSTSNAGLDTTICENNSLILNGSATNHSHTYWNTFGDGSFDNPFLLNATYTPGSEDVINGSVDLVMFAFANSPCMGEVGDTINLTISQLPEVYAGEDDSICAGYSYLISGAGDNYSSIMWSTSGDGTFENSTQLSTYYFLGSDDIEHGSVNLVLTASANYPCDESISDTVILSIIDIPDQPSTPQGPLVILLDTCSITDYYTDTVENANSYQWYLDPLDAGVITGIGINAIVNWNSSYTGIVAYLYVQALNICGETFSDSLIVDISPVGFLNENTSSEIIISPNPSNRIFNLTIKGLRGFAELYVSNTSGKIIRNKTLNITKDLYKYSLDLSNEPSGIYYVSIVFENQKHFDNMIILRKD